MEEQKITQTTITTSSPKVTLKKSVSGKYAWEIGSSEGNNLTEIIAEIEKANNLMLEKFKKEGVQPKE